MKQAYDIQKTEVRWKRPGLEAWRSSLSAERRAEDEARLSEIFAEAAHVPILKEALDWARAHDLAFIIDRTSTVGGYYTHDTGVVAIAQNRRNNAVAVPTVVHEIRHAWQDLRRMLPSLASSFQSYYTKVSLVEADATAYGSEAEIQYMTHRHNFPREEFELQQGHVFSLWNSFKDWYSSPNAESYGEDACILLGYKLGIPGTVPNQFELEYQEGEPKIPGIKLSDPQNLLQLGQTFGGGNYFPADYYEFLKENVLPPSLARSFYGAANNNQQQMVAEIRKRQKSRIVAL